MRRIFFIVGLLLALQISQGYCYAGYDDPKGSNTDTYWNTSTWK